MAAHDGFHGRASEAEEQLRRGLSALKRPRPARLGEEPSGTAQLERSALGKALLANLVWQGRIRDARQLPASQELAGLSARDAGSLAISIAFATRDIDDARAAVRAMTEAGEMNASGKLDGALALVLAGDVEAAKPLAESAFSAPKLNEFPAIVRSLWDAVAAWKQGDLDAAAAGLRSVSESPYVDARYKGLALLGEVEMSRGRYELAVDALEKARATHFSTAIGGLSVFQPGVLYYLAVAYDRLGDHEKAREHCDGFLRFWSRADPDLPRLAEAKRLRDTLDGRSATRKKGLPL
jgi:tetratricopeptide (TPR) repeat protein